MARIIQADYDALAAVSRDFVQHSSQTQQLTDVIARLVDHLANGGWIGVGAEAFIAEMQDLVFPALSRLIAALQDAGAATERLVEVFRQAEEEASRQFDGVGGEGAGAGAGAGSGAGTGVGVGSRTLGGAGGNGQIVKDIWSVINGVLALGGETPALVGEKLAKFLKGAGPGLNIIGGVIEGIVDVATGKEDFFNGMGKGLFSGGADVALDAATGGVYGLVIAAGDLTSLGGRGLATGQGWVFDQMNLDPGVRQTLSAGLDQTSQVFKGVKLSETVGGLKNMIWDVGFRPGANVMDQGWQQGNPLEVMRGAGMIMDSSGPLGAFNMAQNFLSDPGAQQRLVQDGKEFLGNFGNLALSLPQLPNEIARFPLRMGVGAFNNAVNSLPIDPGLRDTLNGVSRTMADAVNNSFVPTSMGLVGVGAQKIQGMWNSLFGGN